MTDDEIMAALKNKRNDKAFGALYKNFPVIKKMILSNSGLREDAEDIFQESLIILCSKVEQGNFILTSKLSTYLYSVCRYLWNDELKRRGRSNIILGREDFLESISLPEEFIEDEQKARLAEEAIDSLGERCKEMLTLFYSKSMKLFDIAVTMGYNSENTAKNQKYKCLEMAKKNLKDLQQKQYSN
ncbi:MAG: sigma-70 family RNA polymerase sigma factor [Bacteroidota bacterium]